MNSTELPASSSNVPSSLPDVSMDLKPEFRAALSRVGMRSIEMPIKVAIGSEELRLGARIEAYVSLDAPDAKGIHMSRLYLEIKGQLEREALSAKVCESLIGRFLETHEGLSLSSEVIIRFDLPLKRKALVSESFGYRLYPVTLRAFVEKGHALRFEVSTEILYSSTCPCSAALARELLREEFRRAFAETAIVSAGDFEKWLISSDLQMPTPHAQRSLARVKICLTEKSFSAAGPAGLDYLPQFIDLLEGAVGTPVQAAVKRVDEQEFARLNGENLMFCEDAARKLRFALENSAEVLDYDIYVEHQESLHPHDAVSRVVKGVPGGFAV